MFLLNIFYYIILRVLVMRKVGNKKGLKGLVYECFWKGLIKEILLVDSDGIGRDNRNLRVFNG